MRGTSGLDIRLWAVSATYRHLFSSSRYCKPAFVGKKKNKNERDGLGTQQMSCGAEFNFIFETEVYAPEVQWS